MFLDMVIFAPLDLTPWILGKQGGSESIGGIREGFLEEVTPELSLKARGGILRILKA